MANINKKTDKINSGSRVTDIDILTRSGVNTSAYMLNWKMFKIKGILSIDNFSRCHKPKIDLYIKGDGMMGKRSVDKV